MKIVPMHVECENEMGKKMARIKDKVNGNKLKGYHLVS